jgi:hypothetical protein
MDRRRFLTWAAALPLALAASPRAVKSAPAPRTRPRPSSSRKPKKDPTNLDHVTLFLGGDVMTGRGIDQVLSYPSDPRLFEPYVRTATRYVELAEAKNGPIQGPIEYSYVWGDALTELDRMAPDVRIINLETSVTKSDRHWRGKGVHYRMHPENVPCIATAGIDCCVLANNHVIDWGFTGLRETLDTLEAAGIETAGAGLDAEDAAAPAVLEMGTRGRVLVFGFGTKASGIPEDKCVKVRGRRRGCLDPLGLQLGLPGSGRPAGVRPPGVFVELVSCNYDLGMFGGPNGNWNVYLRLMRSGAGSGGGGSDPGPGGTTLRKLRLIE